MNTHMTKILVIGDGARDRGLLVAVLEERGYEVMDCLRHTASHNSLCSGAGQENPSSGVRLRRDSGHSSISFVRMRCSIGRPERATRATKTDGTLGYLPR